MKILDDPVMESRAARALYRTWNAIGPDCLEAVAESGPIESVSMTRKEVVESVTCCGYKDGFPHQYGNDKQAVEWLDGQPQRVKTRVLRKAFPYERYGL